MGKRDFIAGYNAAWDDSVEGHNGEYSRPEFTHERYVARRSEAYAEHVASVEAEPAAARETSASIAQWQNETFGAADLTAARFERSYERMQEAMDAVRDMDWFLTRPNLSRALRAAEELAELIKLLVADDSDPKAPREVADIDIVLRGIDAYHGVERADQVDAKMAINRSRKWELTGDGHGQHVKEDE